MRIACIMDPPHGVNYSKDTSYFLLLGAYELGARVFYIDPNHLELRHNRVWAKVQPVEFDKNKHYVLGTPLLMCLEDMQCVLVRTNPPFDRRYFYVTLLLDFLPPHVQVINSPQVLRDWNEKLAALYFAQFSPPTLVAKERSALEAFVQEHQHVVLKPLDGRGGIGIEFLSVDKDYSKQLSTGSHNFSHFVLLQKYVPESTSGDLRVLFLNGSFTFGALAQREPKPVGVLRRAAEGKKLNNLDQGGTASLGFLTQRQEQICRALGEEFLKRGAFFVGVDFLGDYLIEINVTSPTGLQELARFVQSPLHHDCAKLFLGLEH